MKPLDWDAINPLTGQPFTWDDPNLRWGDPSYYLEPGDPGFVPYGPLSPTSKPKTKRMKRQKYYPTRTADQVLWLQNLVSKLAGHAPGLGVDPAECAAAIADARWLIYVLGTWLPAVRAWQKSCTESAEQAQTGTTGTVLALPVFTPPPLPAAGGGLPAVVPVADGALDRIFDLVAEIKESDTYTEAIGTELGIIGPEETAPDYATLQPVLKAILSGTHVEIDWGFQGFGRFLEMLELHVDRADGAGWRILAFDTTPGYNDTAPFPGAPAVWKYRAIYRVNDMQVGLWSATVNVTVGGMRNHSGLGISAFKVTESLTKMRLLRQLRQLFGSTITSETTHQTQPPSTTNMSTETISREDRRRIYENYLREEGYAPRVDDDGDLVFIEARIIG
jgi:hypothetical protein